MSESIYSTYDIRTKAIQAVINKHLPITVVARAYGTDRSTIHRWLSRYQLDGEAGLIRRPVTGRPKALADLDANALRNMVLAPASKYGYETDFWTTRRLIQVIHSQFNVTLSKRTVLRRLHDAGLTYQKPEREYFDRNRSRPGQ